MTFSLQVNADILHETISDEVIIISLTTGNYYSLQEGASLIWQFILQGANTAQVVELTSKIYKYPIEKIEGDISVFLDKLKDENLIDYLPVRTPKILKVPDTQNIKEYAPPKLEVFTDIQDLLTLDPIHDVDEMGWPLPKKDVG